MANARQLPFKIISSSSHLSDEIGSAKFLETYSPTKPPAGSHRGWISSRRPNFPQELLLHMDEGETTLIKLKRIEILSHHFLIATRIEFFISPDGEKFKRLGYIKMSDNIDTEYRARELKSVHLNAVGKILKIVVHEPYANEHNKFSQVGIVAIGLYGQALTPDQVIVDDVITTHLNEAAERRHQRVQSARQAHVRSPLEALMSDPEIGPALTRMNLEKQTAVEKEQYDVCIQIKNVQKFIDGVAPKFATLEKDKVYALENEDYEKAKAVKLQMDEVRLLVLQKIRNSNVFENTPHVTPAPTVLPRTLVASVGADSTRIETPRDTVSPPLPNNNLQNIPPADVAFDLASPRGGVKTSWDEQVPSALRSAKPVDYAHATEVATPRPQQTVDNPLTDAQRRESEAFYDLFGEDLTAMTYSKKFEQKIKAIQETMNMLQTQLHDMGTTNSVAARACLPIIMRLFRDKVYKVLEENSKLFLYLTSPEFELKGNEVSYLVDKCLPVLLQATGESNKFLRQAANDTILKTDEQLLAAGIVPQHVLVPFNYRKKVDPRQAQARIQLASKILTVNRGGKFDQVSMSLPSLVDFCLSGLEHSDGKVRDSAANFLGEVHKANITINSGDVSQLRRMLPVQSDDVAALKKSALWRNIYDILDRVEGKPTQTERKKMLQQEKAAAEAKKRLEIDQLQKQIRDLKNVQEQLGGGGAAANTARSEKYAAPTERQDAVGAQPNMLDEEPDEYVCIFCGEHDNNFNEQGLDLHYWKACPMLKRCEYCGQVTEISAYYDHLSVECEAKDQIPKEVMKQVNAEKQVNNKCSLCKKHVDGSEEGWQQHLMGAKEGCTANPRRIPFLKRVRNK